MRNSSLDHISVCICTYKRPELLANTLNRVITQATDGEILLEVIVVDNDNMRSAEPVVKKYQENSNLKIIYDCEPEQNIALARNRAVRNAEGYLVAFIDDDEIPVKDWLYKLFHTLKNTGADGVLGPVLPFYPEDAPVWLSKCKLFDRRRYITGTVLKESRDTRTGNVLLSRTLFPQDKKWFDPAFGLTGGEDVDFFRRKLAEENKFVWCDEAVAYETIPPERWKSGYYIKRYFRSGTVNGETNRKNMKKGILNLIKYILGFIVWLIMFVFLLPFGKHRWFRAILKMSYFCGSILAICGFSFWRYRDS